MEEHREGKGGRKQRGGLQCPQALTKTQQHKSAVAKTQQHKSAVTKTQQHKSAVTKTQRHKSAVTEDSSENILTESTAALNRWTEYCSGLYIYEFHSATSLLQSDQTTKQEAESLPVLKEEVEEAWHGLKQGSLQEWTTFPLGCLGMEAR